MFTCDTCGCILGFCLCGFGFPDPGPGCKACGTGGAESFAASSADATADCGCASSASKLTAEQITPELVAALRATADRAEQIIAARS
jgi:hypothetical protein